MITKKHTLYYLTFYLTAGGTGFSLFPSYALDLFFSTGDYGNIMPRVAGMFMIALAYLIFKIVRNEDWKYYSSTIFIRTIIVFFLSWLYFISDDPMFLILNGIVLIGLIPSIIIQYFRVNRV